MKGGKRERERGARSLFGRATNTHTHTDYQGKSSSTRKGAEHGWEGAHYRKHDMCADQGEACLTLKENSQKQVKALTRHKDFPSLCKVLTMAFTVKAVSS